MRELTFIIEQAEEGGYIARTLSHSIVTEADDIEKLHSQVRDAVKCHFEDKDAPKLIRLHFVREQVITL